MGSFGGFSKATKSYGCLEIAINRLHSEIAMVIKRLHSEKATKSYGYYLSVLRDSC
jgi:hypothetical protein